jgi:ribosomal protein L19
MKTLIVPIEFPNGERFPQCVQSAWKIPTRKFESHMLLPHGAKGNSIISQPFSCHGCDWRLRLCRRSDISNDISLSLQFIPKNPTDSVKAKFGFKMRAIPFFKTESTTFNASHPCWGFKRSIVISEKNVLGSFATIHVGIQVQAFAVRDDIYATSMIIEHSKKKIQSLEAMLIEQSNESIEQLKELRRTKAETHTLHACMKAKLITQSKAIRTMKAMSIEQYYLIRRTKVETNKWHATTEAKSIEQSKEIHIMKSLLMAIVLFVGMWILGRE